MSREKTRGKVMRCSQSGNSRRKVRRVSWGSVKTRLCKCSLRGMRGSHHCHSEQRSALRAPATVKPSSFLGSEALGWVASRLNFATGQINEAPYQAPGKDIWSQDFFPPINRPETSGRSLQVGTGGFPEFSAMQSFQWFDISGKGQYKSAQGFSHKSC